LCQTYWYPVYAYIRRRGFPVHDSEELTQEFFTQLLEKEYVQDADPEKGRFRSFLLTAVKHFLSKERERTGAKKRGGGRVKLSLDFKNAETRYGLEPVQTSTAEGGFERRWALTLVENAIEELREWYASQGKSKRFDALKAYLEGEGPHYGEVAVELGISQDAVRQEVHRLRKRCRQFLQNQIAETVTEPTDVDDELQSLFQALSPKKLSGPVTF